MNSGAAAIVIDGRVVAAIEEERLSRVKNDGGVPYRSIKQVLEIAKVSPQDVDLVCVYWQPWRVFTRIRGVLGSLASPSVFVKRMHSVGSVLGITDNQDQRPDIHGSWTELFRLRKLLQFELGSFNAPIRYFDHHECHYFSARHLRDWNKFFALTYDGGGEEHSTVLCHVQDDKKTTLKKIAWPNSLGHYYSAFTGFLGFQMLEGEYKMMGLAPYGRPLFKELILNEILKPLKDGSYQFNDRLLNYHLALEGKFSAKLERHLGPARAPAGEFTDHHKNVACSVQAALEHVLTHIVRWATQQHPDTDKMLVAGGCGLNVSANGALIRQNLIDEIVVPSAPHDAGCALGAAVMGYLELHKKQAANAAAPEVDISSPYLGPGFSDSEIGDALAGFSVEPPSLLPADQLIQKTAEILASGQIICWFQGRTEFGPRALGARSFLADPRSSCIREQMNVRIKKRELFRPFAPSCLAEVASEFFEIEQPSPFMNIVAKVREEKREIIPAVTHVDGTARVHTVTRQSNPMYWELLQAFRERTGVGVLLNTSFNIQEPIVNTPSEAISTFLRCSVDWLIIGNRIVDLNWKEAARDQAKTKTG